MAVMFWQDSHRTLYHGDCRSMVEIPDETIQMVVTSPPYWGLRKYSGLPDLIWGGDKKCQHQWQHDLPVIGTEHRGNTGLRSSQGNPTTTEKNRATSGQFCSVCSAWQGQLGLEPTLDCGRPYLKLKHYFDLDQRKDLCNSCYICHTIQILREVRRVLRPDGVCFWNIGDSYFATGYGKGTGNFSLRDIAVKPKVCTKDDILKPKDLCLVPFRLAIALQEDGWWVRSVIIWSKPNPMPESVKDRPTESHEYILMLTKSARYYYDQEAVREPLQPSAVERYNYDTGFHQKGGRGELYGFPQKRGYKSKHGTTFGEQEQFHGQDINSYPNGRNCRSVWTFSTQSFSGAHFATYPEKLVEICVKAGTPEVGCCSKCGKPWVRIVERQNLSTYEEIKRQSGYDYHDSIKLTENRGVAMSGNQKSVGNTLTPDGKVPWYNKPDNQTLGWKPQCQCNADKVPSICLDPFCGSGTTLKVAAELNRCAIGYELSEEYCKLAVERNKQGIIL